MYPSHWLDLLNYHGSMLRDTERVAAFDAALKRVLRPGMVVADLGAGTGILSLLALKHGAARVYAVEAGEIAYLAEQMLRENDVEGRVQLLRGQSRDIELPERVDVLLSETIGNVGTEEGIVGYVADAAERWLKPDGVVLPQAISVWAAPAFVGLAATLEDESFRERFGISLQPVVEMGRNLLLRTTMGAEALQATGQRLDEVVIGRETRGISGEIALELSEDRTVDALIVWFRATIWDDITIDNEPTRTETSWSRGLLPLGEPIELMAGRTYRVEVRSTHNGRHWHWKLRSDGQVLHHGSTFFALPMG